MRAALLALVLLAISAAIGSAIAEKRVALVIGNGAYRNTIALPNAPADGRAVAASLRRLGFHVVDGFDLTHAGMTEKMREFSNALAGADAGMFFYAGHGLQVSGENYLVGVDAALKRESDLEFEAMKVDLVLRQMQRETKVKIVILDACRDNPLARELTRTMASGNQGARSRSTGVAPGMSAIDTSGATGTLIAFATAPGAVALDGSGANSPFTSALLAHIETPGIDIDVMMKRVRGQVARETNERQQPWTNSSLTAEFFMHPQKGATAAQPAQSAVSRPQVAAIPNEPAAPSTGRSSGPSPAEAWQMELALWEDAKRTNTARDYQAYLDIYPNGTFATLARNRIEAATAAPVLAAAAPQARAQAPAALMTRVAPADTPVAAEDRLHLDSKAWREVQTRLTSLGFDTRGSDGTAGPGTRKALQDWQRKRNYQPTGYLDETQHVALLNEKLPERKKATRAQQADDDDEEEAKPTKRTRSVSRPSSSSSEGSGERRRASNPNSGGGSEASGGGGAAVGILLGVAAGVAIGRSVRRRR